MNTKVITQSSGPHLAADLVIDITADRCPMTFVRTRLALDKLMSGQILAITLRGDEPASNVPRTAVEQGHTVLGTRTEPSGDVVVLIRKG